MSVRLLPLMIPQLALLSGVFLNGCTGASPGATIEADGQVRRAEEYCSLPDLQPSTRHTYLLLDQRALNRADSVQSFVEKNREVRDLLQSFGNPERATQAGLMDWRERLSLYLVPADGGTIRLLFTGCLPGLSPAERAAVERQQSALGTFFGSGPLTQLTDAQKTFWGIFATALLQAAVDAPTLAEAETGALTESPLIRSLRESGRVFNSESGLPRIVLASNLANIDLHSATTSDDARAAGFADGTKTGLDFGFSELHVFLIDGPKSDLARDYVTTFALAQNANLETWARRPGLMPPAPQSVWRFSGAVDYTTFRNAVQLRLATDRNGKLVNSWFTLLGRPVSGIPMTGTWSCNPTGHSCEGRADTGGFAQAWSPKTGSTPYFHEDLPLGGARMWEIQLRKDALDGKVFDGNILFKGDPKSPEGRHSLALTGTAAASATF